MSPRISIRLLATQSDQRLVALAREGHERAFEALVHRYRRQLLRYARRMRLSEARAEDVLQQAFMQSWIALSGGADVRDVRSWLYRIVHNVAVNAMRGPAEAHGELTQAVQDRAGLLGVSNLERTIAMRDALSDVAALPRLQRQAIFLTAVDGQSHEQVAGTLGITPGALRGLLYRARSTLRSAAAALTPPPLLAWASAGAGSSAPSAERLAELAAGGGAAAGMAGLFLKGAVVAVTAGAVATGASVLSAHRHAGAPRAAGVRIAHTASSAGPARSLAPGAQIGFSATPGTLESALRRGRSGSGAHRGEHGRPGSSREGQRHGAGSGERRGAEQAIGGGRDTSASAGRGGVSSSGSTGRDGSGSGDSRGRRGPDEGFVRAAGGGQDPGLLAGADGSGRDGSGRGGSDGRGSGTSTSGVLPGESGGSLQGSSIPTAGDQPSGAQRSPSTGAASEEAAASGDAQDGKSGPDD